MADVNIKVGADAGGARREMRSLRGSMDKAQKSAKKLGTTAKVALGTFTGNLMAGAISGALRLGKAAVKGLIDAGFAADDYARQIVRNLGLADDKIVEFEKRILDLAKKTRTPIDEVGASFAQASSEIGFTTESARLATEQAIRLGKILKQDPRAMVEPIQMAMKVMNVEADKAAVTVASMFLDGNMQASQITRSFQKILGLFKISPQAMAGFFGAMRGLGVHARTAVTAFEDIESVVSEFPDLRRIFEQDLGEGLRRMAKMQAGGMAKMTLQQPTIDLFTKIGEDDFRKFNQLLELTNVSVERLNTLDQTMQSTQRKYQEMMSGLETTAVQKGSELKEIVERGDFGAFIRAITGAQTPATGVAQTIPTKDTEPSKVEIVGRYYDDFMRFLMMQGFKGAEQVRAIVQGDM